MFPKSDTREEIPVCQSFFLGTLSISWRVISNARRHKRGPMFAGGDGRGKSVPPWNKFSEETVQEVRNHIESFKPMESGVRAGTKRKYLESSLSQAKMWRMYKEAMAQQGIQAVSFSKYKEIFGSEYNIGFQKPKKERCHHTDKRMPGRLDKQKAKPSFKEANHTSTLGLKSDFQNDGSDSCAEVAKYFASDFCLPHPDLFLN